MPKNAIAMPNNTTFNFAPTELAEEQATTIWKGLQRAITEIHNGNVSKLRFEECYRNAYNLVLHKFGDMLYDGVKVCVSNKLQAISLTVAKASDEALPSVLVGEWEKHKLMMSMLRDILMYMDKVYCKQQKKDCVFDMGVFLFRDMVLHHPQVGPRLKIILLDNVHRERVGEHVDADLMKNCLSLLVEADGPNSELVYQQDFEIEFLAATQAFYRAEAQEAIDHCTVPEYLVKIERRLQQEENRADLYLHKSTKPKLRAVLHEELISHYATRLVSDEKTGCLNMFANTATDDLKRMYSLFKQKPPTLALIRTAMSNLIKDSKVAEVPGQLHKNMKDFVGHVVDLKLKFDHLLKYAFEDNREFAKALKDSLEYFLNLDSRAACYLSLYLDDLLKTILRQPLSQQEAETTINNVMSIFKYLQDKDVFEDWYKQHLSTRLLNGTNINDSMEKSVIDKLKAECGHQFTSRLEGMFKDMARSTEIMQVYRDETKALPLPCELNVTVLTTGWWPLTPVPDCRLPPVASQALEHFRNFYTVRDSGRRLAWQCQLGTCELKALFNSGRKELVVSTYQMCILLLFNEVDQLTTQEIKDRTKISDEELPRQLLSLAHPKIHILKKTPNTRAVEPDHTFAFNDDFTSNLFRVKVPLMALKNPALTEEPSAAVLEARKNWVEAAVVRIMKSRKTINHNNLVAEVVKQLSSKFAVEMPFIKKRIESLIEREYMERDKNDRRLYHYLA